MNKKPNVPIVITKHYDLLLWLMQQVSKFPRNYKFVLGDRIQNHALDVLECLIEAIYSKHKQPALKKASLVMENIRYLMRCAHDLKLFDQRRYQFVAIQINEIGRMIGGWQRAQV